MKRAARLTLIGNAGFRMLTDLHFSTTLVDITYDELIKDLDKAYGNKSFKYNISGLIWNCISTRVPKHRRVYRRVTARLNGLRFRQPGRKPTKNQFVIRLPLRPHQE